MKFYKPTSKSRRNMSGIAYGDILTESRPFKGLVTGFKRGTGRNNQGRITTRHKGGGHKRRFRMIDFAYGKMGVPGTVSTIEYDPNRTGFIGLISYKDGEKRYVLLPKGVTVGDVLLTGNEVPLKPGNRMEIGNIPVGTFVYNVELKPHGGAKIVRSAGSFAEVIAHDAGYTHLKLPSTEVRKIPGKAFASVGEVSNPENRLVKLGKAGRSRWLGIRPTVRGTAMNPVDHPHGGGEGRQGRGLRRAKSMWGKPTGKGQKTRTPKKYSNAFIVSRRRVGKQR